MEFADLALCQRYDFYAGELRLLEEPNLRSKLAANARTLVESRYGWGAIGERFCALVEATAAGAIIDSTL